MQKSTLERASPPTFDVAVEIIDRSQWRVHTDVAEVVDQLLRGHVSAVSIHYSLCSFTVLLHHLNSCCCSASGS